MEVFDSFDIKDKVVIVTGAAGGLGDMVSTIFLKAGAKLALLDQDQAALSKLSFQLNHPNVFTYPTDVSDLNSITNAINATIDHYAKIDILITCAGVLAPYTLFFNITESDWDKVMNVNVKGTWLVAKVVSEWMIENKVKGNIVT